MLPKCTALHWQPSIAASTAAPAAFITLNLFGLRMGDALQTPASQQVSPPTTFAATAGAVGHSFSQLVPPAEIPYHVQLQTGKEMMDSA